MMRRNLDSQRGFAQLPDASEQRMWKLVAGAGAVAVVMGMLSLYLATRPSNAPAASRPPAAKASTVAAVPEASPAPAGTPAAITVASPSPPRKASTKSAFTNPALAHAPSPKAGDAGLLPSPPPDDHAAGPDPAAADDRPAGGAGADDARTAAARRGEPIDVPERPSRSITTSVSVNPPPATRKAATVDENASPAATGPAPVRQVVVRMSGQDYEESTVGRGDDTPLGSPLLGVSRVSWDGSGCSYWLFVYNATSREQRVSLVPRLQDASGRFFDATGGGAPGQTLALASGHVLYLWPRFAVSPDKAGGRFQISLGLEGHGRLYSPATEQMTNLGAWGDLPATTRDQLGSAFNASSRFRWWGGAR